MTSSSAWHSERRGFREYLTGLSAPRERNKAITCLAGAEPVAGAGKPGCSGCSSFLSESPWEAEQVNDRRPELPREQPATAPHDGGAIVIDDSGWPEQSDVGFVLDEGEGGQVFDPAWVEVGLKGEVAVLQRLVVRQLRQPQAVAEAAVVAASKFLGQHQVEQVEVARLGLVRPLDVLVQGFGQVRQAELGGGGADAGAGQLTQRAFFVEGLAVKGGSIDAAAQSMGRVNPLVVRRRWLCGPAFLIGPGSRFLDGPFELDGRFCSSSRLRRSPRRSPCICKKYGDASISIVKNQPCRLAADVWGIGFLTTAEIAH